MTLQPPTRVNYFSGQLLDAADFRDEQDYHRGRQQRVARLAIGSGVLCGLAVTAGADGQVVVEPGIALDPLGREIVVAAAHRLVDPFQPTDDDGQPGGAPRRSGPVTLLLAYAEETGEPPDRTIETYRIEVREGDPPPDPGHAARDRTCRTPADAGVVLATLTRSGPGDSTVVVEAGGRRDLHSVAQLLDLVLGLADRLATVESALSAAKRRGRG